MEQSVDVEQEKRKAAHHHYHHINIQNNLNNHDNNHSVLLDREEPSGSVVITTENNTTTATTPPPSSSLLTHLLDEVSSGGEHHQHGNNSNNEESQSHANDDQHSSDTPSSLLLKPSFESHNSLVTPPGSGASRHPNSATPVQTPSGGSNSSSNHQQSHPPLNHLHNSPQLPHHGNSHHHNSNTHTHNNSSSGLPPTITTVRTPLVVDGENSTQYFVSEPSLSDDGSTSRIRAPHILTTVGGRAFHRRSFSDDDGAPLPPRRYQQQASPVPSSPGNTSLSSWDSPGRTKVLLQFASSVFRGTTSGTSTALTTTGSAPSWGSQPPPPNNTATVPTVVLDQPPHIRGPPALRVSPPKNLFPTPPATTIAGTTGGGILLGTNAITSTIPTFPHEESNMVEGGRDKSDAMVEPVPTLPTLRQQYSNSSNSSGNNNSPNNLNTATQYNHHPSLMLPKVNVNTTPPTTPPPSSSQTSHDFYNHPRKSSFEKYTDLVKDTDSVAESLIFDPSVAPDRPKQQHSHSNNTGRPLTSPPRHSSKLSHQSQQQPLFMSTNIHHEPSNGLRNRPHHYGDESVIMDLSDSEDEAAMASAAVVVAGPAPSSANEMPIFSVAPAETPASSFATPTKTFNSTTPLSPPEISADLQSFTFDSSEAMDNIADDEKTTSVDDDRDKRRHESLGRTTRNVNSHSANDKHNNIGTTNNENNNNNGTTSAVNTTQTTGTRPLSHRIRSGDEAAATLATGGSDWRGMTMDQIPLPASEDDDEDEESYDPRRNHPPPPNRSKQQQVRPSVSSERIQSASVDRSKPPQQQQEHELSEEVQVDEEEDEEEEEDGQDEDIQRLLAMRPTERSQSFATFGLNNDAYPRHPYPQYHDTGSSHFVSFHPHHPPAMYPYSSPQWVGGGGSGADSMYPADYHGGGQQQSYLSNYTQPPWVGPHVSPPTQYPPPNQFPHYSSSPQLRGASPSSASGLDLWSSPGGGPKTSGSPLPVVAPPPPASPLRVISPSRVEAKEVDPMQPDLSDAEGGYGAFRRRQYARSHQDSNDTDTYSGSERPPTVQQNRLMMQIHGTSLEDLEDAFDNREFMGSFQNVVRHAHVSPKGIVATPLDSPFNNIGKRPMDANRRASFAPQTVVVDEDKHPTFLCPRCKTRQRAFFTVHNASSHLEGPTGYLAAYFVLYVAASLFIFGLEEGWDPLDCVYFAVISLTTAGLGDYVPRTDSSKIICSIFIYFGVACIGLLLGSYLADMLDAKATQDAKNKQMESCPNCARIQSLKDAAARRMSQTNLSGRFQGPPPTTPVRNPVPKPKKHFNTDGEVDVPEHLIATYKQRVHRRQRRARDESTGLIPDDSADTPPPPPLNHNQRKTSAPQIGITGNPRTGSAANILGSPMTREILGRQTHTRHASFDINGKKMPKPGKSPTESANGISPPMNGINETTPLKSQTQNSRSGFANISQHGFLRSTNSRDEDTSSDGEDDSADDDSISTCDEIVNERISRLKAAKYVLVTLQDALGNSLLILAVGCIGFYFIENLSWIDSWYFTTVLLTTTGYGDIVPITKGGKLFATIYLLVGGTILLNYMSRISMIPLELRRRRIERAVLTQFDQLDDDALKELATGPVIKRLSLSMNRTDGLAECTREMFALAMLVRLGKVSEQDIRETFAAFRRLDVNNEGVLNSKSIIAGMIQRRKSVINLGAAGGIPRRPQNPNMRPEPLIPRSFWENESFRLSTLSLDEPDEEEETDTRALIRGGTTAGHTSRLGSS